MAARALVLASACLEPFVNAGVAFPEPTVEIQKVPLTAEQKWMDDNWPGYHNGVNIGGHLVIENWMFMRAEPPFQDAHLQLDYSKVPMFNNNMWSNANLAESLHNLRGSDRLAVDTMWCHMDKYYTDEMLDEFASFGINSARVPLGYWIFDDPELFPNDPWPVPLTTGSQPYGVNPEGFLTPGTLALSNLIVRLWNRNMKVMLDMHALPGCSTPHQSYAGIECAPKAPNFWAGLAEQGISNPNGPNHTTTRSKDGKTWADVYHKLAVERVVPYIDFINSILPGAVVAYEMMNEPDLLQHDATAAAVRTSTVDLAKDMMSLENVAFGLNDGAHNYGTDIMSDDLLTTPEYKDRYWLDIHHYFNWPAMCNVYGEESYIDIACVCEANVPNTTHQYEQGAWANFMKKGLLDDGYRLYIGEWSAGLQVARNCNNPTKLPNAKQAQVMWRAQKLSFLTQYLHYQGLAAQKQSSFLGDFYWAGRMGHNWNADPSVCCCGEDPNWVDFEWWDWSLLNMIRLNLAQPMSKLGWTPETIEQHKGNACTGPWWPPLEMEVWPDTDLAVSSAMTLSCGQCAVDMGLSFQDPQRGLQLEQRWQLPEAACALAAAALPGVVALAGTRSGDLFAAGPGEELASAGAVLAPAYVTALHVGPPTDGLGGILDAEGKEGPRALFIAGSDGRILRAWLPEDASSSHVAELLAGAAVCAEVLSPVLALELCTRTSRLLVSTSERVAVLSDALAAEVAPVRWVGSKPHKGSLTATFGSYFGPEAIIAPRRGGRLWVADGSGTVQTTLIFQNARGEKVALGHLLPLKHDCVLSFVRHDEETQTSVGPPAVLLDLEAIAISHQWPVPPVVDAVPWHGGALLAHPHALSLLLADEPQAACQALVATHNLGDAAALAACVQEVLNLREALDSTGAGDVLEGLAPLFDAVDAIEVAKATELRQWVADLEERWLFHLREEALAEGKQHDFIRLIDAPLSNFPTAAWEVDDEEIDGKKDEKSTGDGDEEGLLIPYLWQQCLERTDCVKPAGDSTFRPAVLSHIIQALEAPGRSKASEAAKFMPWLMARMKEDTHLAEPAALLLELLCSSQEAWPGTGLSVSRGSAEPWSREQLMTAALTCDASAAFGLCQHCLMLANCELLERCLFWINGMVAQASSDGWLEVFNWVKRRLESTSCAALPTAWNEALKVARSSVWAAHRLLQDALSPQSMVNVRDVFDAAADFFPKVLPWNIADWMAWAFQPSPQRQACQRRETLLDELPYYLLRLLPTCKRPDMLRDVMAVALHRRPFESLAPEVPLHVGHCLQADSLLRFGSHELCCQLRYPLGLAHLTLSGFDVSSCQACCMDQIRELNSRCLRSHQAEDLDLTDDVFDKMLSMLVVPMKQNKEEDIAEQVRTCPICSAQGVPCPAQSGSGRAGKATRVRCHDGRINLWHDLAVELRRLSSSGSCRQRAAQRWRHVLDVASSSNPGLLAALVALAPDRAAAEVCLHALTADANQPKHSAGADDLASAAEALWQSALGEWLELPSRQKVSVLRPQADVYAEEIRGHM
ncbi:unnamed protein product [Effrenium voratum]|uniref:glucan 1,3-beta-glucosidase n=1 Tax=Effrenium voratum TaxID=2562239 RepID=A0AA36JT04_9DINO|nr:unnamed protein product [Effrenium voratum]